MYVSPLTSPLVPDDATQFSETPATDDQGQDLTCGYQPRDWDAQPEGSIEFCEPFPGHFMIDRGEWRERIEERERNNATLKQQSLAAGIETVSQNGTNYCWSFGSTRALEIVEAVHQGQPHVPLSPTAVACKAKNFANRGGNTFDWIPIAARDGVPTAEAWPLNRRDRQYNTPEVWATGAAQRMHEWWELPRNSFDAMASCLLRGWPVIIGVAWWSHMICAVDLKALPGGVFGVEIWNSHGRNYGENGFAVLSERKGTAFDQACPMVSEQ